MRHLPLLRCCPRLHGKGTWPAIASRVAKHALTRLPALCTLRPRPGRLHRRSTWLAIALGAMLFPALVWTLDTLIHRGRFREFPGTWNKQGLATIYNEVAWNTVSAAGQAATEGESSKVFLSDAQAHSLCRWSLGTLALLAHAAVATEAHTPMLLMTHR